MRGSADAPDPWSKEDKVVSYLVPLSGPGSASVLDMSADSYLGPFTAHLGFRLLRADADGAAMEADPGEEHLNGGGILHGGYLGALLDSATGWAVHAADDAGVAWPHVQLNTQFIRAARAGELLTCTARCVSRGRRMATAEAEVHQNGRIVARATSTHAALRPE